MSTHSSKVKTFKNSQTVRLSIEGMHCGNCATSVEKTFQKTDGVYSAVVNLSANTAVVAFDKTKISLDDIPKILDKTAFSAKIIQDSLEVYEQSKISNSQMSKLIFAIVITIVLVVMSKLEIPGDVFVRNIISLCLCVPVQFICGWHYIIGAVKSIKNKSANMDVLVAVGTLISFFYSLYLTFTNIGPAPFETCALLISFISFGEFIEDRAKWRTNNSIRELISLVPDFAKNLKVGQKIHVDKNSSIPADAVVVSGKTEVDESMLTGESNLISKNVGDEVTGGTFNVNGDIEIEVSHSYADSTLAKIVRAVSDAQGSKAPVQRIADKVSSVFVPIILIVAVLTFIVWMIVAGNLSHALMCACSITIVACPCALVLATPTALTVGIGRGAQLGIIFRSGSVLEVLHKIKHIVFDKTGTLTLSNLEKDSQAAKTIRPDAKETISKLQQNGITTYMVSGDIKEEAYKVSDALGFDRKNVVYGADPLSKKEHVKQLVGCNKYAFVGDGINDALSLAAADVGITLESGTDIALETGNAVLMHNKLYDINTAIRLSKSVMRKIKQNMFWALIYNVFMVPLAAFGIMMPTWCGAVHAISSIIVVLNALLLKRFK